MYSDTLSRAAEYRWYGACSIALALEWDYPPPECVPDIWGGPSTGPLVLQGACVWIENAIEKVASLIDTDAIAGEGPLWSVEESSGRMTVARWEFWKSRLQVLKEEERLSKEERERASRSLNTMEDMKIPLPDKSAPASSISID